MSGIAKIKIVYQPSLFDCGQYRDTALAERQRAGKRVVDKLLAVRRSMTAAEAEHAAILNDCIEKVRAVSKYSQEKRFEMVLYAIEISGAISITEIADDIKLPPETVKDLVIELGRRGVLYKVPRYCPGSGRPQFAIKSSRVNTPEAG